MLHLMVLQQTQEPDLLALVIKFLAMGGVAAAVAAIVNVLKTLGVVQDGQAPTASLLLNLAGLVAMVLVGVFAPATDLGGLDETARGVAAVLIALLNLATQLGVSRLVHDKALKGMAVVGKSHAQEIAGSLKEGETKI